MHMTKKDWFFSLSFLAVFFGVVIAATMFAAMHIQDKTMRVLVIYFLPTLSPHLLYTTCELVDAFNEARRKRKQESSSPSQ